MYDQAQSSSILFFRVSTLSHLPFCSKRAYIECFTNLPPLKDIGKTHSIATGIKLHWQYSYPYKSFDRVLVRSRLKTIMEQTRNAFQKQIDNIVIRGIYDDLRIIRYNNTKYCSLIEVKTTYKRYMWKREIQSAIKQLELYQWLLRECLEAIGFPLWKRSYLEIYSQKNGNLIRRIAVPYNEKIEDWIREAVSIFNGTSKANIPPFSYCRLCPKQVKIRCSWYKLMLESKRLERIAR